MPHRGQCDSFGGSSGSGDSRPVYRVVLDVVESDRSQQVHPKLHPFESMRVRRISSVCEFRGEERVRSTTRVGNENCCRLQSSFCPSRAAVKPLHGQEGDEHYQPGGAGAAAAAAIADGGAMERGRDGFVPGVGPRFGGRSGVGACLYRLSESVLSGPALSFSKISLSEPALCML